MDETAEPLHRRALYPGCAFSRGRRSANGYDIHPGRGRGLEFPEAKLARRHEANTSQSSPL